MTAASGSLAGKTIALGITGSIAAYKAVVVARGLVARGAKVLPVMTASATRFVGPVTLSGITGQPVRMDMWDPSFAGEMHVELARQADLVLVVPATADLLARMATGRCDDLLGALILSARSPVLLAPAMHPRMWSHPAVATNVQTLRSDAWTGRARLVGPTSGAVASGEEGLGRMAEPDEILQAVEALFADPLSTRANDLLGKRVLVTAGPTQEPIDPVRFVGNRSSGRMGFAIAERAAARGARVTLVAGPVALATPANVKRVDVATALEMQAALDAALGPELAGADVLVMAAAVADSRPSDPRMHKWKKGEMPASLALTANPDLLAAIGARRDAATTPLLVGFALETGDVAHVIAEARRKRAAKKVDLVVANVADVALGGDATEVILVGEESAAPIPFGAATKHATADRLLDVIAARLKP